MGTVAYPRNASLALTAMRRAPMLMLPALTVEACGQWPHRDTRCAGSDPAPTVRGNGGSIDDARQE